MARRQHPAILLMWASSTLLPASARAQPPAPLPGRFEVAAGTRWIGPTRLGILDATETGRGGARFRLFSTESDLEAAVGPEVRVGVRLTRLLQAEASLFYSTAQLSTTISSDVEGGGPATATESVTQFLIEGAIVAHLTRWRLGRQGVPYLAAGAGYLRQLHEQTLIETGQSYHVGGGLNYLLKAWGGRGAKAVGVRADARAGVRVKGVAFDDGLHVAPTFGASMFLRF